MNEANTGEIYLTVQEAMEYLKFSKSTINKFIREKEIPVIRVNRRPRFRKSDLDLFMNAHLVNSGGSK